MSAADLTEQERQQINDFLSHPLDFPPEFKNWLTDWLGTNTPPIPVSQLLGYKGTLANIAVVDTQGAWTSADAPERTWNSAPDGLGPSITGLADGTYMAAWGVLNVSNGGAGGATDRCGPSVNGADPVYYTEVHCIDQGCASWKMAPLTLANKDNNTIELKYYYDLGGGGTGMFDHRWLMALRIT